MYCSKCGKELSDNDLFCPTCGTKVGSTEQRVEEPRENRTIAFQFSEQEVKGLIYKLIYIVLIYFVWRQSQKGMFEINRNYPVSIDGLMDQVYFFKQYAEESLLVAKICYWCFKIAIFGYVAAAVLALLQREEKAKTLSNIGFLLHLSIILYTLRGIVIVLENWGFGVVRVSEVLEILSEEFWIYVALNIIIVICGARFFANENFASQDSDESYSILNDDKLQSRKLSSTEWRCPECGRINSNFFIVCSCGCTKDEE